MPGWQWRGNEELYYDFDSPTFTERNAILTIRQDTGATAPANVRPTIHILTRSKGDNATFIGATGMYVQARDRTDVTGANKGVLYGVQIDVNPLVARNNSPWDDADGLTVANSNVAGDSKATDAIYVAHNSAFSTNREWITGVQVAGNCDYAFFNSGTQGTGVELRGTYANYGIDFNASSAVTGAGVLRMKNNDPGIVGRNAAGSADVALLKVNTNNDASLGSGVVRANPGGPSIGFFSTTPATKQTVTGAKGSNAALGSLMTALVAYGLVTDSTSA